MRKVLLFRIFLRDIPLLPILAERMKEGGEGFVFGGNKVMPYTTFKRKWAKLQKDIPALQDVSPHRLHHTFLMFLRRSGVDAATQQYLMEHTSFEMTLHYQHEDYDSLKKIICSIA